MLESGGVAQRESDDLYLHPAFSPKSHPPILDGVFHRSLSTELKIQRKKGVFLIFLKLHLLLGRVRLHVISAV